jgi:leader peptidase (prepilin peptidase)/N-methyltransferase
MIRTLATLFAGLLGLAFGSFLNVCLSRWPQGESVVAPRSHCRTCDRTLTWWENIPLVSWLALRGRCRTCHTWIGCRYPLVEAAVGALWAIQTCFFFGNLNEGTLWNPSLLYFSAFQLALNCLFLWILVALAMLDAENLWLPDWLTLPGIALGLLFATSQPWILARIGASTDLPLTEGFESARWGLWTPACYRLLGCLAAAGIILLTRWLYWLLRRREGLGLGDAKLMALIAAWIGLPGAILSLVIGVTIGSLAAIVFLLRRSPGNERWSQLKLPLGTFLCIGGIVSSLWGEPIIAAYLRWAGF